MKRPGFTLIEVIIALGIASALAATVIMSITQMSKVQVTVDEVSGLYMRASVVKQLLDREINGVFIPKPQQNVAASDAQQKSAEQPKPTDQAQKKEADQKAQEKEKPVEKPLVFATKNNTIEMLSYITTNPLNTYDEKKSKPRIARIVYRLQPEQNRKDSFALIRQEGADLDLKNYAADAKKNPGITVIDGIKSLQVTALFREVKEGEKPQWKKLDKWPKDDQDKDKNVPELPQFIELNLVLWNTQYKQETAFNYVVPILGRVPTKAQQQPAKAPEKPEAKPAQKTEPAKKTAGAPLFPKPAVQVKK